jgi:dihydrolipoamide dehydrogenase
VPGSIAVDGGGVIGVEFAYLMNRLGSKVTVLELMDHILPMVDREVSAMAQKRMEKDGIVFRLGAKVRRIKDNAVAYSLNGEEKSVQADAVLMAVGRAPNTDGLGAEEIGLKFEHKAIKVNDVMRTDVPNIYAIGDVNGKAMLAHTASHEGMVALSAICGGHETIDYDRIPSCIYLDPEIACIGLTEEEARKRYGEVRVGKFPLVANGKSLVEGDVDGMFKVVADGGHGEILGVHLYGRHVTEMISEIAVAMTGELTVDELLNSIHPHPTVSEALPEAFMAATGRAVHWL